MPSSNNCIALAVGLLALAGAIAEAAPIDPNISITGSADLDTGNTGSFDQADIGGTMFIVSGGTTTTSTYSDTGSGSPTVVGSDPLSGTLTDTGDGFGATGSATATGNAADDGEFFAGLDIVMTIANTHATDIFQVTIVTTFTNEVDSSGADAYVDSEFTLDRRLLPAPPPGTEEFFTQLVTDTVNGNEVGGNPVSGLGGPLTDSGTDTLVLTLNPGDTYVIEGDWTMDGGAFWDSPDSSLAGLDFFGVTLTVTDVRNISNPDVSITGSANVDNGNTGSFDQAKIGGTMFVVSGGITTTSTYSDTGSGSATVVGPDPLNGTLTVTGDGFGVTGFATAAGDAADDGEFFAGLDIVMTIANTHATDIFQVTIVTTFTNEVDSSGADAYVDSEFTLDRRLLPAPPPGTEEFFTQLVTDTVNGNEVGGNPVSGLGGPLTDSGTDTLVLTLNPGDTYVIEGDWTMDGGAFWDSPDSSLAGLDFFGVTLTITDVQNISNPLSPPVIVDANADVTLWAVTSPGGTIVPEYSTNLCATPIEWLAVSVFSNSLVGGTNMIEFDPPDPSASAVYFRLLHTP